MPTEHRTGSPAIAALLGIAFVFFASSCGQSTSSAKLPTPSAAPSPTPAPSLPASPPQGGPVPAQLLGDWFLPPAIVIAVEGNSACRLLQLTLTATTYQLTHDPVCGVFSSSGDVVVNNTEIDFFSADVCGLKLPHGVGRYTWTLTGGLLNFVPLNQDPCPRGAAWLAYRSYSRTSNA
jgi:hypothetical protein